MPNILQVGTYCSRNKGDAAMEISLARTLTDTRNGVEITISSPFPDLDRETYHPLTVIRCSRRRLIWATVLLARAWLWGRLSAGLGRRADFLVKHPELQGFLQADLVVDLSGDMLTEDYGPHVAYSHFLPLLTAMALKRPVMLCAQSIGPFKFTRGLARYVLKRATLITVRENISLNYLHELGIRHPGVHQTADLAFLLQPAPADVVDEALASERLVSDQRPWLGVSFSNLVYSHYKKRNPDASDADFFDLMAGALDRICEQYGLQVVFVPHVTGPRPSADDRVFARRLGDRMRTSPAIIQGDYPPDVLKGLIGRCSIYLGARMHANIAAVSSGVPTLAIAYSHKTAGIMRLLGQEEFVCDIDSLGIDGMAARFEALHSRREQISADLRKRAQAVKADAFRNIELIGSLLDSAPASG